MRPKNEEEEEKKATPDRKCLLIVPCVALLPVIHSRNEKITDSFFMHSGLLVFFRNRLCTINDSNSNNIFQIN